MHHPLQDRLNKSIITLQKGQGNPIRVVMICNPRRGLPSWDVANYGQEDGIPLSLPQCCDSFFSPTPAIFHQKRDFNAF